MLLFGMLANQNQSGPAQTALPRCSLKHIHVSLPWQHSLVAQGLPTSVCCTMSWRRGPQLAGQMWDGYCDQAETIILQVTILTAHLGEGRAVSKLWRAALLMR